jgi:hypothetical protein
MRNNPRLTEELAERVLRQPDSNQIVSGTDTGMVGILQDVCREAGIELPQSARPWVGGTVMPIAMGIFAILVALLIFLAILRVLSII